MAANPPYVSTPPATTSTSVPVTRVSSAGSTSGVRAPVQNPSSGSVSAALSSPSGVSSSQQQSNELSASTRSSHASSRPIPVGGAGSAEASLGASTSTVSPPLASPGMGGPPASPTSSNRFGLNLGGVFNRANRPRGFTITRDRGLVSPGGRPARSPGIEEPNSPGAIEGNSSGGEDRRASYFPSIMRQSRRRLREESAGGSGGGGNESSDAGATSTGVAGSLTPRGRAKKTHSHNHRVHRDASAPADLGEGSAALGTSSQSSVEEPNLGGQLVGGSDLALSESLPAPRSAAATAAANNAGDSASTPAASAQTPVLHYLRLVPHLDSTRSLHFLPVERKVRPGMTLKVGRFTDRGTGPGNNGAGAQDHNDPRIAFKSKVVSRGHADIYTDANGNFFIKDTKSSSGTFLNHIRLSGPGNESRPFPLRDGDVLQLGVDYQGGTEEMYRCVKMRVELNRDWQRGQNNFKLVIGLWLAMTERLMLPSPIANRQWRSFVRSEAAARSRKARPRSQAPSRRSRRPRRGLLRTAASVSRTLRHRRRVSADAGMTGLFSVTVCQALFIAPCSHVYHYKCIRPLLQMHHPGFSCPLCRTFADLEADVETEEPMYVVDEDVPAEDAAEQAPGEDTTQHAALAVPEPRNASVDLTPGVERSEADVFATLRSGSRPRPTARDSDEPASEVPPASGFDSPRRTSVIVAGPHGVGVPFTVSPAAAGRSRPASVRSVASPMTRRQQSSVLSSDDEEEEDAPIPSPSGGPRPNAAATVVPSADQVMAEPVGASAAITRDNEDSEMRDAEGDASSSTVDAPAPENDHGPPLLPTPVVMSSGDPAVSSSSSLFSAIRAAAQSAAQPFLNAMEVDEPAAAVGGHEVPRRVSEGSSGASSLRPGTAGQGRSSSSSGMDDDKVVKVGGEGGEMEVEAPESNAKVVGSATGLSPAQTAS